jgi:prepilin-type N-terminal cleavage/methylation domain-containing protein
MIASRAVRRSAFTLIELLLVLVIVLVILGLSFPDFKRARERLALRTAADTVVYAMRYARSRSVVDDVTVRMSLDADAFRLEQSLTDGGKSGDQISFGVIDGRMGRRVTLPSGVHFREAPAQILFRSDGDIDPVRFAVAGEKAAFIISTKEMPGHVVLIQEWPDARI